MKRFNTEQLQSVARRTINWTGCWMNPMCIQSNVPSVSNTQDWINLGDCWNWIKCDVIGLVSVKLKSVMFCFWMTSLKDHSETNSNHLSNSTSCALCLWMRSTRFGCLLVMCPLTRRDHSFWFDPIHVSPILSDPAKSNSTLFKIKFI